MRTLRELEDEFKALAQADGPNSHYWDLLWRLQQAITELES